MTATSAIDLGSEFLHANIANGVLRVQIDRPERKNSMTTQMYYGVKKACRVAEDDPQIDVIVVTGTGDMFCPGGEMGGKHESGSNIDVFTNRWDVTPFVEIERCPKLFMVSINGMCQGGGLVMTLMSDLSIAVESARFRVPELLRGVADPWVMGRLASRVGMAQAKRLAFTGRYFSAQEALAMGIIGEVVPDGELEAAVDHTLEEVRSTGPRSRTMAKRDFNRQLPMLDNSIFQETVGSPECVEAWNAFIEKRPPQWPGRD
jgi:enoyl-CoA hydratase/carnithine racemase